jgi:hypothetical protein
MKYVLTVQRTYETQVVVDALPGVVPSQLYKYGTRHLGLRFGDFEMVEETIDDVRDYVEMDDEHLDVVDYVKG